MDILDLLKEREKTHGAFSEHAWITQQLKSAADLDAIELSCGQRESLEMIFHKIGRILAGNPNIEDHWNDIAGYAILGKQSIKEVI